MISLKLNVTLLFLFLFSEGFNTGLGQPSYMLAFKGEGEGCNAVFQRAVK